MVYTDKKDKLCKNWFVAVSETRRGVVGYAIEASGFPKYTWEFVEKEKFDKKYTKIKNPDIKKLLEPKDRFIHSATNTEKFCGNQYGDVVCKCDYKVFHERRYCFFFCCETFNGSCIHKDEKGNCCNLDYHKKVNYMDYVSVEARPMLIQRSVTLIAEDGIIDIPFVDVMFVLETEYLGNANGYIVCGKKKQWLSKMAYEEKYSKVTKEQIKEYAIILEYVRKFYKKHPSFFGSVYPQEKRRRIWTKIKY